MTHWRIQRDGILFTTILGALAIAPGCGSDDADGEDGAETSTGADDAPTDDDGPSTSLTTTGPADGSESEDSGPEGSSSEDGGSTDGGEDTTTGDAAHLEVIEMFDPAMGQLPEGLAVRGDTAYVSFAVLGHVYRVDLTGATDPELFAQTPPLPTNMAFVTGLVLDDEDRLYVAMPSFVADPAPGVYRSEADGGDATLWATHESMVFPSGMRFDADGNLFVTDSMSASVFRITPDGEASVWITDPLLAGDKTICGNDEALFDIGANGIALTDGAVYVAVSDQAQIVEIPIEQDGSAGAIEVVVGPDCEGLGGIDDMERAEDGTFYAALNHQNRIGIVDPDGTIGVLVDDPALDFPSTVRFGTANGEPALYVTSFALTNAVAGLRAHPSLAVWAPL